MPSSMESIPITKLMARERRFSCARRAVSTRRSINGAVASAWTGINAIDALAAEHTVILYDRRECGQSSGRIERLSWASYTRHGKALLDHLKIQSAWIMGGCMGCSVALAFGVHYPEATRGLLLHWPVGGYRWKVNSQERFMRHYNFTKQNGLPGCRRTRARRQELLDGFGGRSVGDGDRARSRLRRNVSPARI